MEMPSDLLAMMPCMWAFLDSDEFDILAASSVSSDIFHDISAQTALLCSPSTNCKSSTDSKARKDNDDIISAEPPTDDAPIPHQKFHVLASLLSNPPTFSVDPDSSKTSSDSMEPVELERPIDISSISCSEFQMKFRMKQSTYRELLSILEKHSSHVGNQLKLNKNVEQNLHDNILKALHYLGSQKSIEEIGEMFHTTESEMWKAVKSTIDSLYNLMQYFIVWPSNIDTKNKITEGFESMCKLPNIVGVINSIHIECASDNDDVGNRFYLNANGKRSIILQAVCDHQMRFLHCCAGWPGSLDNISVLHDSDLLHDIEDKCSFSFLEDSYLIGDEGYPLYNWLVTPIVKEKSKFKECELQFNFCHSLAADTISKAFLHMKRRFPRLECLDVMNLEYLVKTVLVSCGLHNLSINQDDYILFTDSYVEATVSSKAFPSKAREIIAAPDGLIKREGLCKHVQCVFVK